MRKIITFVALALAAVSTFAAPVSPQQALRLATQFGGNAIIRHAPGATMKLAYTDKAKSGENLFYVFNRGQHDGYVIVSADDRVATVLGYADNGSFSEKAIPSNMKAWLDGYARQISWITSHPSFKNNVAPRRAAGSVLPLLGDIAWDQTAPYNNKCPNGSATGCVATAVGQIMYYHRWPEHGTGQHSYTTGTNQYELSANFDTTYYRWDDMLPVVTTSSPQAAKDAVSTLLYQVGVALNMDYDESSGAYSSDIAPALINYFGYDKGVTRRSRDYYTTADWDSLVRFELDNARPVVYDGATGGGLLGASGHSFVCDGYNSDGYFHINWGWSGTSNGYFLLSALDPDAQGTGGASAGSGGFNYNQDFVGGIQKPVEGSKPSYQIVSDGVRTLSKAVERTDSVDFTAVNVYNESNDSAVISFRFNVTDTIGNVVASTSTDTVLLHSMYGLSKETLPFAVPASLNPGKYRAYLAYNINDVDAEGEYNKVLAATGKSSYYDIIVTADSAYYTTGGLPALSLRSWKLEGDTLYSGKPSKFTFTVHNSGGEASGELTFALNKPDKMESRDTYYATTQTAVVPAGADKTFTFEQTLDVYGTDDYLLRLYYINGSGLDETWTRLSDTLHIPVVGGEEPGRIEVTKDMYFTTGNDNVNPKNMELVATIANDGGTYRSHIVPRIYEDGDSYNVFATMDTTYVEIPAHDTVEVHFHGRIPSLVDGETYNVTLFDEDNRDGGDHGWISPSNYSSLDFTVCLNGEDRDPRLYILEKPHFVPDNDHVNRNNIVLKARIQNTGRTWNGVINAEIMQDYGYTTLCTLTPDIQTIPYDSIVEVTFTGAYPDADLSRKYEVDLTLPDDEDFYSDYRNSYLSGFSFVDGPTTGIQNVNADETNALASVYTVTGMLVGKYSAADIDSKLNALPHGQYIIRKGGKSLHVVK